MTLDLALHGVTDAPYARSRAATRGPDVGVGDHVALAGRGFAVVGIAVTAAQALYPNLCYFTASTCANIELHGTGTRSIGPVWTTEAHARDLASPSNPEATSR